MADSLRDQLLKTGLPQKLRSEARDQRAAQPRPEPRPGQRNDKRNDGRPNPPRKDQPRNERPRGDQRQGGPRPSDRGAKPTDAQRAEMDLAKAYALRERAEREERERVQRENEQRAREKKERRQKVAMLLQDKALNHADADVPRHFPHGTKIRRIYCTAEQLPRLNRGELGVVQQQGRYLLVEREIALAAQAIEPESLVLLPDPNVPAEDDIPPDLVW